MLAGALRGAYAEIMDIKSTLKVNENEIGNEYEGTISRIKHFGGAWTMVTRRIFDTPGPVVKI